MRPLRLLIVEDVEDDAELLLLELRRGGYQVVSERVCTAAALRAALVPGRWDLVISDYSMPGFSGLAALGILKESGLDLPLIILSGTIGEEVAVEALKAGAHDFLVKGRLARLLPAIERELQDAGARLGRRATEDALRESEERFRTLVGSMEDVVFTLDPAGRVDGLYGSYLEREGVEPAGFLGRTAREIYGEALAAPHEEANARARRGERTSYEWASEAPSGTREFQTSLSPILDADGQVRRLVGVTRDVTEQKGLQAQLLVADRMVSIGTLAAGVAHEINNPLAAVLANLDMAVEELTRAASLPGCVPCVAEVREALLDAREAGERVRVIVRDLKLFSRSADEASGPVDVVRALESTLRMASNEIRHRATLVRDFQPVPPVTANESRLGQVFLNLIVNAAQAIPEGRAGAHQIRVVTRAAEGWVAIEIHDTGDGIAPDVRKRLFTPFFTTKPAGVGTGLGLSICHRIVTAAGGRIEVESAPGRGTMFRVLLPAAAEEAGAEAQLAELPAVPGRRGRVLVVDDEPMITLALLRTLSSEHEVTTCDGAAEALDRIQGGQHFDVILCDLVMPQITGMELHARLLALAPDQARRMIFVTGGAFTARAREFLDEVENLRIEKPFDIAAIRTVVNQRIRLG